MIDHKNDPLAWASATPDVSVLQQEFDTNFLLDPRTGASIAGAEDVRYNRWGGKSNPPDGMRHQQNQGGAPVLPYDRRPDTDVNLADELCGSEVDMDTFALQMATVGADAISLSPVTASQVAELAAIGRYIRKATRRDMKRGGELLSQMKATLGWALLNPGWLERWGLVTRELTMEQFEAHIDPRIAGTSIPDEVIAQLPPEAQAQLRDSQNYEKLTALIRDPSTADQAAAIIATAFPHLPSAKAKTIVNELREDGVAEFVDKQLEEKRPTLRVLIPGYNVFILGGDQDIQQARGFLVVERFYAADLISMGTTNDWNKEFVNAVQGTAGNYSQFGDRLRLQDPVLTDSGDMGIEIWTTYVRQVDADTNVAGIYCTTFSPHVTAAAGESAAATYAKHYLLDYAHGMYPFSCAEREVIGPSIYDSRGIPEMVRSDQQVIKTHQDALAARAQWETSPAQVQIGPGWSKVKDGVAPGSVTSLPPGADLKFISPERGSPQVGEAIIQRIEAGTRRRFALPNTTDGSHPSAWQMRQSRNSSRWLGCWEDAYWQLAVLCYQELNADELAQIIGKYPQLTVQDLLHTQITLKFESRALDQDWTKTVLGFIKELLMMDKGGIMDTSKIVRIGTNLIDPAIGQEILTDVQTASARLYSKVENDVASIMDGNLPKLVEMDASAEKQLEYAMQVMGQNPKYQQIIAQDVRIRNNFETYVKNLRHSAQETAMSPVQGRTGVSQLPKSPMRYGSPQLTE